MRVEALHHLNSKSSKEPHGAILSAILSFLEGLPDDIDVFVRERAFSRYLMKHRRYTKWSVSLILQHGAILLTSFKSWLQLLSKSF